MSDTKKKHDEIPALSEGDLPRREGTGDRGTGAPRAETFELRIVCLHRGLDEDLMFRETMIQHLDRTRPRPPLILVAGAGEFVETALQRQGHFANRVSDEISLESDRAREVYERAVRESGRQWVSRLSESGIASVFLFGGDRRLVRRRNAGALEASGLDSVLSLAASGVVPVVGSASLDAGGKLSDVHPIRVTQLLCSQLQQIRGNIKTHMVFPILKIPVQLAGELGSDRTMSLDEARAKGLKLSEEMVSMLSIGGPSFSISALSGIGGVSQIRVGV